MEQSDLARSICRFLCISGFTPTLSCSLLCLPTLMRSAEPDEFGLRIVVLFNEMNAVSSDRALLHLNRLGALSPADMCLLPLPASPCATQTEVRRSRCSLPAWIRILPH